MGDDRPDRILRLPKVLDRTGLSRSTLYRKIGEGSFPQQVRIAERCVGWREAHIEEWLRRPTDPQEAGPTGA
jgi:prophage regulatory protein